MRALLVVHVYEQLFIEHKAFDPHGLGEQGFTTDKIEKLYIFLLMA